MSDQIKEQVEKFPSYTKIVVKWGEMDAYQHVNNAVYFKWAETARIEYLQALEIDISKPNTQKEVLVIGQQECKYLLPVTFPDTIWVGTQMKEIKEDRMTMECQMFSEQYGRLVAISKHRIFILDKNTGKKILITEEWKARIEQLEQAKNA